MSKYYGVYTKKGKILAVGTLKHAKRYVSERKYTKCTILDITDIYDYNICKQYMLKVYDEEILDEEIELTGKYLLTVYEREHLMDILESFLGDFKNMIEDIQSITPAIKDDTFRNMIEDGVQEIDNIIFNSYNSNDYADSDINLISIVALYKDYVIHEVIR